MIIDCQTQISGITPVATTCDFQIPKSGKLLLCNLDTTAVLTTTSIITSAVHTTALASTTGTKNVATPIFTKLNITPTEYQTTDSGRSNGIGRLKLVPNVPKGSFLITGADPKEIASIKGISALSIANSRSTKLGAYIFDENGLVYFIKSGSNALPIPLWNFTLSSIHITEGENFAQYNGNFELAEGWDDNLSVLKCSFDVGTTIVNA